MLSPIKKLHLHKMFNYRASKPITAGDLLQAPSILKVVSLYWLTQLSKTKAFGVNSALERRNSAKKVESEEVDISKTLFFKEIWLFWSF